MCGSSVSLSQLACDVSVRARLRPRRPSGLDGAGSPGLQPLRRLDLGSSVRLPGPRGAAQLLGHLVRALHTGDALPARIAPRPARSGILAVSIDENPDAYNRFLIRHHVDLITVRDPDQKAAQLYHTDGWPETYIIDRQGFIRRKVVGPQDWNSPEIRAYLKNL